MKYKSFVFTVIFDQFNVSLLNKSIYFFYNKTAPKPLNGEVCSFSQPYQMSKYSRLCDSGEDNISGTPYCKNEEKQLEFVPLIIKKRHVTRECTFLWKVSKSN